MLSITALCVTVLGALAVGVQSSETPRGHTTVCETAECKAIAHQLLDALAPNHTKYDPCTDFDRMVCGGWEMQHELKPDQESVSILSLLQNGNEQIMKALLDAPYTGNGTAVDKSNFEMMQNLYKSCMDQDLLKRIGVKPLFRVLQKVKKLFPASNDRYRREDRDELTEALTVLAHQFGVQALVKVRTLPGDAKNPDVVYPMIIPPPVFLPSPSYYNDTGVVTNYTAAIATMFRSALGDATDYHPLAKKILQLEAKIARASEDAGDDDVVEDISEVEARTPAVSVRTYLTSHYPEGYRGSRTLVRTGHYFEAMSEILEQADREAIQGFLVWQSIVTLSSKLHPDFRRPLQRLENSFSGLDLEAAPERWTTCVRETGERFRWIYGAAFVGKAFSPEAKALAERMVGEFKGVYSERLEATEWMGKAVKQRALLKVKRMGERIGYPTKSPDVLDPESVRGWYGNLSMSETAFFDSYLEHTRFSLNKTWATLLAPLDRDEWIMTVPEVNAYNLRTRNEIVFPAGILQPPLFHLGYPEYINYGSWGSLVSHEISHGFDSTGRHYDESGRLEEWWDNKTLASFEPRARCFIDQYDKYQIIDSKGNPRNISGSITQDENIADAGGINTSFEAWKKREAAIPGPLLPGLGHFSKEQLFYVSFGLLWCSKKQPEYLEQNLASDNHAPDRARIQYTTANSRGFLNAFNCPKKEPVCELW
ncbi:hypothetical protein NM208_g1262 [Fusarium decemcellulare]|uniref:Uncharacterized protein n=1 Tax=Fusarium decemcellulare TaxID=57161 RepID=A0ACC1SWH9_9HYPO|nr:hypothetical protein NM208_g1262 [Fusarium decemcellulare]